MIDKACPQFGIDGQLLARHGIQGETSPDFGYAPRSFRNHDELNRGEDDEHDNTYDEIAGNHETSKGVDDLAGIRFEQDKARGRHFDSQAKQGREQKQTWEGGNLQCIADVNRDQEQDDRHSDVKRNEQIEKKARQRHDHHAHNQHNKRCQSQVGISRQ